MGVINIEQTKEKLIHSIIMHQKGIEQGNAKIANKYADEMLNYIDIIQKHYDFRELKDLLDHEEFCVRVYIAKTLLPYYELISLKILREIGNKNIPHISFEARIIVSEHTGETLRFS
ncbi:hypothetical protein ACFSTE_05945 [Aquimarina hainanensis]|uniref:Uncharacterized protein n=1 Tax=Aquimarina hainanensis TaxID=1578017 RepID=A0ABW5N5B6_9FLAO